MTLAVVVVFAPAAHAGVAPTILNWETEPYGVRGGGPDGTKLVMEWSAPVTLVDPGGFFIYEKLFETSVEISALSGTVSGNFLYLTLATPLEESQEYYLSVAAGTVTAGGMPNDHYGQIRLPADMSAPMIAAGQGGANGDEVIFLLDERYIDPNSLPDLSAFTVKNGSDTINVTRVALGDVIDGFMRQVVLTLASSVTEGAVVKVSYTKPEELPGLQDYSGNKVASFTDNTLPNNTVTPPALQSATVNGNTLTLTYSENLDTEPVPSTEAFAVTTWLDEVTPQSRDVTNVLIVGDTVILTLQSAVLEGKQVVIHYDPVAAEFPIQDLNENEASWFEDQVVTNLTDMTPPSVSEVGGVGTQLMVTFDDDIDEESVDVSKLSVQTPLGGPAAGITSSGVDGNTLTLGLNTSLPYRTQYQLVLQESALSDEAGNDTAGETFPFTTDPDTQAPTLSSAMFVDNVVTLTFDENVFALGDVGLEFFEIAIGGTPFPVTAVQVVDNTLVLTLSVTPSPQATVLVSYTPSNDGDYADAAENVIAPFSEVPATYGADEVPPAFDGAEISGSVLVVDFDEALDGQSTPAIGAFIVKVNGQAVAVEAANVVDGNVELTLAQAVEAGDVVTVSYAGPETDPLQDEAGNDVADFTDKAVVNNTPDSSPPELMSAVRNGSFVTLTYDEALDAQSLMALAAFTLTGAGFPPLTPTGIQVGGSTLVLDFGTEPPAGETTLAYEPAGFPVRNLAGLEAEEFGEFEVVDQTPPTLLSAWVDGWVVWLEYDRYLDDEQLPAASTYQVWYDIEASAEVSVVRVFGKKVRLELVKAVPHGADVVLHYAVPEENPLRSKKGGPAGELEGEQVDNRTPQAGASCDPEISGPAPLNLGFEAGLLTGWSTGTVTEAAEVITLDAVLGTPWEGVWMARLGGVYDGIEDAQGAGSNEICQEAVVTESSLTMAYNLISYDVAGADRFSYRLWDVTLDELVAFDERPMGGPGEGRKTTGWKAVTFDLTGRLGHVVRLTFDVAGTVNDDKASWAYVDYAGLSAPERRVFQQVEADNGSVSTNEQTGETTVALPFSTPSPVTVTTTLSCDQGVPEAVELTYNGQQYSMSLEGDAFTVTIPEADVTENGDLVVTWMCEGDEVVSDRVGTIVLYDPSGTITDADTGDPVVGATITLWKVPGWTPKDAFDVGDCETNLSKAPGAPWSQPAPTHLGVIVAPGSPEISPNVNPMVTNLVGYYGWDVAAGCWYLTIEKEGYQTATSPVVGVPTAVTDLDIALTPTEEVGGGTSGPVGVLISPDERGEGVATLPLKSGPVVVTVHGLTLRGRLVGEEFEAELPDGWVALGPARQIQLTRAGGNGMTMCVAQDAAALAATGSTAGEAKVLVRDVDGWKDATTTADGTQVCGRSDNTDETFVVAVPRLSILGGGDPVAAAAALSAARFQAGSTPIAYLARSDDFADALAAAPAAARDNAPLLLTLGAQAPAAVLAELERLDVGKVIIVGGPAAVPAGVATQLAALGYEVRRLRGPDRYGTTAVVSSTVFGAGVPEVLIATGRSFPDALAGGSAAARLGVPVVLVPGDTVPEAVAAELRRLRPGRITVLGGRAAVSDALLANLAEFTDGPVERVSGPDRFDTSARISRRYFSEPVGSVFVAAGGADAGSVAAVTAAAVTDSPLLLVERRHVPTVIQAEIRRLEPVRAVSVGLDSRPEQEIVRGLLR